jgi:ATP-dependent protease ClpP protease subunit
MTQKTAEVETISLAGDKDFFTKVSSRTFEFYLSGEVKEPEYYIEWFDTIRNAGPDDDIIIYINSMGGNLDTAIQFMRVIAESQAHITTSAEGSCMSAATVIFLQGSSLQITPFSLFMFHNYSGGAFGKGGEMYDNIMFERAWSKDFLHEVYKDFLTEDEINSMLENKDIWMGHKEVEKRCQNMLKAHMARQAQENELED